MAEYLENHPKVAWVNYPGLPGDKYYELAQKYMPNGTCGVVTFGVKGGREGRRDLHGRAEAGLHRHPRG